MSSNFAIDRPTLQAILQEFIVAFKALKPEEIRAIASRAGPNAEKALVEHIEKFQSEIFSKHGIAPQDGFPLLGKARQAFASDGEIVQLLVECQQREEGILDSGSGSTQNAYSDTYAPFTDAELPRMADQRRTMESHLAEMLDYLPGTHRQIYQKQVDALKAQPLNRNLFTQMQQIMQQISVLLSPEQMSRFQKILLSNLSTAQRRELREKVTQGVQQLSQMLPMIPPQQKPTILAQLDQMQITLQTLNEIIAAETPASSSSGSAPRTAPPTAMSMGFSKD
eukprot:TRINITY_DN2388_c0_g1_i1.p1 TRINITY_DN2388_c0_g1~~TRINITY_DN2388_c0_g1_i1.p1  ORF type:complete len:302 (-),score=90.88 TRINITY_DN2388_c0_g1_i1:452-1294(-)